MTDYAESVECTELCRDTASLLVADPTLNLTSLCRCAPGYGGIGVECEACAEDHYSVRPFTNMTSVCVPCRRFATTDGATKAASWDACTCSKTKYNAFTYAGGHCGCRDGFFMDRTPLCRPCGEFLNCSWQALATAFAASQARVAEESLMSPIVLPDYFADDELALAQGMLWITSRIQVL